MAGYATIITIFGVLSIVFGWVASIISGEIWLILAMLLITAFIVLHIIFVWGCVETREKANENEITLSNIGDFLIEKKIIDAKALNEFVKEREQDKMRAQEEALLQAERKDVFKYASSKKKNAPEGVKICEKCGNQIFFDEDKCSNCKGEV